MDYFIFKKEIQSTIEKKIVGKFDCIKIEKCHFCTCTNSTIFT